MTDHAKGVALITGASGGIGAVYAERLAARGYDLILTARNRDRLEAVAETVRGASGRTVEAVAADMADGPGLRRVEDRLRGDAAITLLVNNAGFGSAAPMLQADPDAMERMIGVNVTAVTRLACAAAPAFVARGHGAIINVASTVALNPELLNGVYGASKAYVLAFTQSLQHELAPKGVRIQAVLPGATATEFWNVAGVGGHRNLPASIVMTPADLVAAALAGFDAGEVITIPPLENGDAWSALDAARLELAAQLGAAIPASRYRVARAAAA
ncbi:SDR family oxidoreductase [Methylobacterium oryzae]|uniref:NADP-dependent 3-hydroxy acid dehydrogenase YdfG n=1 Tax=Methylobacterium oryzae TaxID=334852 RepID=A0ABU7TV09_9HYPH